MVRQAGREYAPSELEARIQQWWGSTGAYGQTRAHRARGERFYFIDGPPYTTGSIHLGTAWNKTLKDVVVRHLRMKGFNVRDQPGYDMHGLPIEVKVEKALGIKNKKEIEHFGIDRFISQCRDFALTNLQSMTRQFASLGVWMDWDKPYMTITNPYIEAAWWTLKRAAEKDLLTRLERSTIWCPRCQTALAEAELEYWDEDDPSIYVKFKAADADEHILIWTTTPWTIPADLAVTLHPDLVYVRAKAVKGGKAETLIFVRDRLEDVKKVGGYDTMEVLTEMKGSELEGKKYLQPLADEVPWHRSVNAHWAHRVLVDPDMVTNENTGCVHTAPGHGPADFDIGRRYELPLFCPVDGTGHFTAEAGKYAGMELKAANAVILDDLRMKGLLLHSGTVKHRYGHCWRCDTAIIYIITMQWYLRITAVKDRMLEEVARVRWYPPWAGSSRQKDWVEGARDWCISRQRYWGIPLPIWECAGGHRKVVGRISELEPGKGYKPDMDLHRPWIDDVTFACPDCGSEMRRVPDVMDVWLDSGVASWAELGYPGDEEEFKKWWPCRWITEAHDQTRGWFYSQLGAGVVAFDRAPYDSVLMHGWSLDPQGRPMSKSLGNIVEPSELTGKFGADALRFYFLLANAPWDDMPFSLENVKSAYRTLNILWNVHVFSTTYMALDRFSPGSLSIDELRQKGRPEDLWLLSRIESMTKRVNEAFGSFSLHHAARAIEEFVLEDLSRWYVRLVRDRVWTEGEAAGKLCAYRALYQALHRLTLLLAPIAPHVSEAIYSDLEGPLPTVHMGDWPLSDDGLIDLELEEDMAAVRTVLEASLNARNQCGLKLRWPLRNLVIAYADKKLARAAGRLGDILKDQANCRQLALVDGAWKELRSDPRPVMKALGPNFGNRARAVADAVAAAWGPAMEAELAAGRPVRVTAAGSEAEVTSDMVAVEHTIPEGWVGAAFDGGTVYLDTRLDDELRGEGLARDLVRRFQQMRKEAGLQVEDRIAAGASLNAGQARLLEMWKELVRSEIRAVELRLSEEKLVFDVKPGAPQEPGTLLREWELDQGEKVLLHIRKA